MLFGEDTDNMAYNKSRKSPDDKPSGSPLKGTSDDPSSGLLTLTLEKILHILQKWQEQETGFTDKTIELILKSGLSRDKPEKVSSVGPSSAEASDTDTDSALVQQQASDTDTDSALVQQQASDTDTDSALVQQEASDTDTDSSLVQQEGGPLKGTSDDPSSGLLTLTLEKILHILLKWKEQETGFTDETIELILKSGFSRDKPEKVSSVDLSSAEASDTDTDLALVQQQASDTDSDSALDQQEGTEVCVTASDTDSDSALDQQEASDTDTDSALVQQKEQASSQSACQPVSASLLDQTSFSSSDLSTRQDKWTCPDCNITIRKDGRKRHLKSDAHIRAARKEQASSQSACHPISASLSDQTSFSSSGLSTRQDKWTCPDCNITIRKDSRKRHLKSDAHIRAARKDSPTTHSAEDVKH